jgi:hypothetical protein
VEMMAQKKSTVKDEKNTEVVVHLDRPRFLRFGHRALKKLSSMTGKKLTESINNKEFSLEELETIMWCGLLSDAKENNETLKLEDMEDLLDSAPNFNHLITAMNEALDNAFKETEKQKN